MKLTKTKLEGVVILEPQVFGDHRGFFMESWSKQKLEELAVQSLGCSLQISFVEFLYEMESMEIVKHNFLFLL